VLPASVAAEVGSSARGAPTPLLPPEAAVAHLIPEHSSSFHQQGEGGEQRTRGAVTSWRSVGEGWQTRGSAEWRSSPAGTGRVANTPRPADSVRSTRIGGGPRAAAAAVERRRRRSSMNRAGRKMRLGEEWRDDQGLFGSVTLKIFKF
jgi:hypothetical protein